MKASLLLTLLFVTSVFACEAPSVPARITVAQAREFCLQRWFPALRFGAGLSDAEKERKLDQLMRFYTSNVEFADPNNVDSFGKPVLRGLDEIKGYYRLVLSRYPEWQFEIKAIYPTAEGFVLHYIGRNAPPVAQFEGVDVIQLEQGTEGLKIKKLEGFFDRLPFTRKP